MLLSLDLVYSSIGRENPIIGFCCERDGPAVNDGKNAASPRLPTVECRGRERESKLRHTNIKRANLMASRRLSLSSGLWGSRGHTDREARPGEADSNRSLHHR